MWGWLLNHWWVATVGPYMAFNIIIVWRYNVEEGPLDHKDPATVFCELMFLLVGVWVFAFYFVAAVGARLWQALEPSAWTWPKLRQVRRWAANTLLWGVFFITGSVIYGASLSVTGYYPGPFERAAILGLLVLGATFGVNWIRKELKRP